MARRVVVNVGLSLLVAVLFLYLAFRNVAVSELGTALAKFDVRWLPVAVSLSLLIMLFRAWRWQLELRPLTHIGLGPCGW